MNVTYSRHYVALACSLFFIFAGAEIPRKGWRQGNSGVRVGSNFASPQPFSAGLARKGLIPSPQVEVESRSLLQQAVDNSTAERNDNSCTLKEKEIAAMLDEKTRTWSIDMAALKTVSDDFDAIIRCTQKGDVVLLSTVDEIRLPRTVTIPWKLTLSAFTEEALVKDAILPEAERKTTFVCPPTSSAFQVRAKNVALANLVFENCTLQGAGRSIIEARDCSPRNTGSVIKLHHVAFQHNALNGGSGLSIASPSCHSVEMVDVSFSNNLCGDVCFAHLSKKNNLEDVRVHHNRALTGRPFSLIFAPPESSTSINRMSAYESELTVFRVVQGQLNLTNAKFERNFGHSTLVLEEVTQAVVTDSLFRGNSAIMSGAGILADGTKRLEVSNCSFLSNKAENGAAVASLYSSVSIDASRFLHNIAVRDAGAVFIADGSLNLKGAHFENNTASGRGGALYLDACDSSQVFALQCHENAAGDGGCLWAAASREVSIQNSSFTNNSAVNGGALYFVDVSSSRIINLTVTLNTAREKGGGLFLVGSTNIEFHHSFALNNTAEDGGGLGCERTGNLTIRRCLFESNDAEVNGAGAWISEESSVFIEETNWTGNKAELRGGAVSIIRSNVTSRASSYSNNQALYGGALIFTEAETIVLEHDAILNNKARVNAGGILSAVSKITLRSCQIAQNQAPCCAGIFLATSETIVKNTTFEENLAYSGDGAGLYSQFSNLTLEDSRFKLNYADQAGGAITLVRSQRVTARNITVRENESRICAGGISVIHESQFQIYNSMLENNRSPLYGALDVGNAEVRAIGCSFRQNKAKTGASIGVRHNGKLFLENSTMMSNHASQECGGIYGEGGELNATNVVFSENTARLYGGSLSGTDSSVFVISNCSFLNNQADRGGGFRMQSNSSISVSNSTFENNTAIEDGGGGCLENSTMEVTLSAFRRNRGSEGGSLSLSKSTLRVFSSSFKEEKASVSGGAISANAQSSVSGMNTTFSHCSSGSGGAVFISKSRVEGLELQVHACSANASGGGVFANDLSTFSCLKCSFDDNKANRYGGAIAFDSTRAERPSMQLDNCSFRNNLGDLGGALHVSGRKERENCSRLDMSCTIVVVTDIIFSMNKANTSGGAIFVEDSDILRYACLPKEVEVSPFGFDSDNSQILIPLTSVSDLCREWSQNQAGDYGPTVGSYAKTVRVYTESNAKDPPETLVPDNRVLIDDHRSGDPLPRLFLEILDGLEQGPPLRKGDEYVEATMYSPYDAFFAGSVKTVLNPKQKELPAIYSLQRPGPYEVIVNFTESDLPKVVIEINVRSCNIGESVQESKKLCVPCAGTQYNFDNNASTCMPCPVNGNCTSNAIFPNRGYWHRTPCSQNIQECISKEACDAPERDMDLFTIQQDMRNCYFNKTLDKIYAETLCKQGYKGTLCGSCDVGYGHSRGLHCSECRNDPEMISLFVATLIVLLLLSSFTIASNLQAQVPGCSRVSRSSKAKSFHSRLRSLRRESATEVPVNFQMVEMLSTGHVPPELINPDLFLTTTSMAEKKTDLAMSKANIVEVFKIAINFLQVIGAAVFINANWTTWIRSVLSAADFFSGAAMDGMTLSADCLFAAEHQPPRSVLRTTILLVVPTSALMFYVVFWAVQTYRSNQHISYFARTLMLSTLALIYLTYISITKTAVDTLHCIRVHDSIDAEEDHVSSYWALDTSLKCYEGSHKILASTAGWPVVILFTFGTPLALAYALSKTGNRCPDQDGDALFAEASGFLYRAYKERFVWWESVIMFRKAALTIVVAFSYPLGANLQGVTAVCLLTFATYLHVLCRPFREEHDYLNGYETASLFVSVLTFASGLFFNDDYTSDVVRVLLTILLSVAIGGLLCLFAHTLLSCIMTHVQAALVDEGIEEAHDWGVCHSLKVYVSMITSAFFARLAKYFHPAHDDHRGN